MPDTDGTQVDAAEFLAHALRHLDDYDTRRPFTEIPTLDDSTSVPFRPFPALAVAMAGHVLSAWEVRTFRVEKARRGERIRFFTAVGGEPERVLRACTLFDPETGTQQIFELCGHSFCSNKAPAGPGSRCADHLGDPVPEGCHPDHWLTRAAQAAYSTDHGRGGLTDRQRLAVHAADAGVPLARIGRETGVYPWRVHLLSEGPAREPEDVGDEDDPACWPDVFLPVRDITAADVHRVYHPVYPDAGGVPAEPAPDTVLARKGGQYYYEPLRPDGPYLVDGEESLRFTLEWWQTQEHLPDHLLARRGDDGLRRALYEPPCSCGDCD